MEHMTSDWSARIARKGHGRARASPVQGAGPSMHMDVTWVAESFEGTHVLMGEKEKQRENHILESPKKMLHTPTSGHSDKCWFVSEP